MAQDVVCGPEGISFQRERKLPHAAIQVPSVTLEEYPEAWAFRNIVPIFQFVGNVVRVSVIRSDSNSDQVGGF